MHSPLCPGREGGLHCSPTPGPPLWSQGQKPPWPPEPLGPCQTPGRKQRLQGLPPTSSVRARLTPGTLTLGPNLPGAGGPEPGGGPSTLGVLGVWEGLGLRRGDTAGASSGTLQRRGDGVKPRINMGGTSLGWKEGLTQDLNLQLQDRYPPLGRSCWVSVWSPPLAGNCWASLLRNCTWGCCLDVCVGWGCLTCISQPVSIFPRSPPGQEFSLWACSVLLNAPSALQRLQAEPGARGVFLLSPQFVGSFSLCHCLMTHLHSVC